MVNKVVNIDKIINTSFKIFCLFPNKNAVIVKAQEIIPAIRLGKPKYINVSTIPKAVPA